MKKGRAGGLLIIAILAILLMACGLTMAFGLHNVSKILFLTVVALLIGIWIGIRKK